MFKRHVRLRTRDVNMKAFVVISIALTAHGCARLAHERAHGVAIAARRAEHIIGDPAVLHFEIRLPQVLCGIEEPVAS